MKPALSVRIAEQPRRKDRIAVSFERLAALAAEAGFEGLSLRASVVAVDSDASQRAQVREVLERHRLAASMVTGDLALAANSAAAPQCLADIEPYLDLAEALGCDLLRVMVHGADDLKRLSLAADAAAARGMRLAQQCHWGSMAETVDDALALVDAVARSNVGITFEPANLMACGSDYQGDAVRRLGPHLANVYFQNLRLASESPVRFASRARGDVGVEFLPLADGRGIDIGPVVEALRDVGYRGWFTVHQPCLADQSVEEAVASAGRFVDRWLR